MTYRVIFQPRALADLRSQYEYLAERNPAAAARWFNHFAAPYHPQVDVQAAKFGSIFSAIVAMRGAHISLSMPTR